MGQYGPVPKRADKRLGHRTKAENAVTRLEGAAAAPPELGFDAHPLAADWYESLKDGPEAQFYTPAMCQRARLTAEGLSNYLRSGKRSSMLYQALQTGALACSGGSVYSPDAGS